MKLCNILDTLGKCYSNIAFASLNNFSGVFLNCAIFQILNWICQFQRPNYSASMNIWLTLTKTYLFAVSPSFWANSCLFQAGMACILLSSSSLALSSNASCLALSAAFLANISLFHFGISLPRGSTAGIYKKYLSTKLSYSLFKSSRYLFQEIFCCKLSQKFSVLFLFNFLCCFLLKLVKM